MYILYVCISSNMLPQTSSLWFCSAVTSSPAHGNFQQGALPARRASSPAAVGSFSPPPRLLSGTAVTKSMPTNKLFKLHIRIEYIDVVYIFITELSLSVIKLPSVCLP